MNCKIFCVLGVFILPAIMIYTQQYGLFVLGSINQKDFFVVGLQDVKLFEKQTVKKGYSKVTGSGYTQENQQLNTSKRLAINKHKTEGNSDPLFVRELRSDTLRGDYYTKSGDACFSKGEMKAALDHFLKAETYYKKSNNWFALYDIKVKVAAIYGQIEAYETALSLLKECEWYFKKKPVAAYKKSYLHALIWQMCIYYRLSDTAQVERSLIKAKKVLATVNEDFDLEQLHCAIFEAKLQAKNNPQTTIDSLKRFAKSPLLNAEPLVQSVLYKDIGLAYLKLNKKREGIHAFATMDSIVKERDGFINSELRYGYEKAIEIFKNQEQLEQQLYFIDRLLYLDRIRSSNYKTLNHILFSDYEKRQLMEERDHLRDTIDAIKQQQRLVGFAIFFAIVGLLCASWWYLKNPRKQKKSILDTAETHLEKEVISDLSIEVTQSVVTTNEIKADIVKVVLVRLEQFEQEQGFLDPLLTLSSLASKLETNTAYLSYVINKHKRKRFAIYINEMRINLIYERMMVEQYLLKYSIEGLAKEGGFKTAQKFSDAFYQFKGARPSVYIRMLQQNKHR